MDAFPGWQDRTCLAWFRAYFEHRNRMSTEDAGVSLSRLMDNLSLIDSEDLDGPLQSLFRRAMAFIKRNLRHIQAGQSFNCVGQLEIPEVVFEEQLVNAPVHRDYLISAPIRLFVFADRVEIISPGHLPDHLTPPHTLRVIESL